MSKKKIIVSGINMTEGGIFSILKDLLVYLDTVNKGNYEIIALVNNKSNFKNITKSIKYEEYPNSKKSWFIRLYYEYFYFYFYSKNKDIDLWLSMHDMTPNVKVKKLVTYCHNATPFYSMAIKEAKYDKKLYLFSKFYKFLYRINIKKNNHIIVQQEWIKKEFENMYKIKNIIINPPIINISQFNFKKLKKSKDKFIFFYPSIPRVFKNFELICEVAKKLEAKDVNSVKFILTLDKGINKYGDYIFEKYKDLKLVEFVGKLSREEVFSYYEYCDALIFPSKLETWGLPLSEFKYFNKPILVSDLPYAKETIGDYKIVNFFNPSSIDDLEKNVIKLLNNKNIKNDKSIEVEESESNWEELFKMIFY